MCKSLLSLRHLTNGKATFQCNDCIHLTVLGVFMCSIKLPAWADASLHWFHLFGFSPLCVWRCLLKEPAWAEAKRHCWNSRVRILFEDTVIVRAWQMDLKHENICLIFLSWNIWSAGFVSFLLTCPPKKSTSFLQAAAYLNCNYSIVFKCVSSKSLLDRMQSHTGCICSTFLHYEFSNVFSNCLHEKLQNQIGCISWIFL